MSTEVTIYKPLPAGTHVIGKVQIDGSVTTGSDATAANQATEIARLESIRDRLPEALANGRLAAEVAGENYVGRVGVTAIRVAAAFARPADTDPYGALDAISDSTSTPTVLTFAGMGRVNGGSGSILKAQLLTDNPAFTAQCRLHLFNVAPTAINDNAPHTTLWANRASRVGEIDFPALTTEGTGSTCAKSQWVDVPLFFICAAADTALYGILEARTAGGAPASAQNFHVVLSSEQY